MYKWPEINPVLIRFLVVFWPGGVYCVVTMPAGSLKGIVVEGYGH